MSVPWKDRIVSHYKFGPIDHLGWTWEATSFFSFFRRIASSLKSLYVLVPNRVLLLYHCWHIVFGISMSLGRNVDNFLPARDIQHFLVEFLYFFICNLPFARNAENQMKLRNKKRGNQLNCACELGYRFEVTTICIVLVCGVSFCYTIISRDAHTNCGNWAWLA